MNSASENEVIMSVAHKKLRTENPDQTTTRIDNSSDLMCSGMNPAPPSAVCPSTDDQMMNWMINYGKDVSNEAQKSSRNPFQHELIYTGGGDSNVYLNAAGGGSNPTAAAMMAAPSSNGVPTGLCTGGGSGAGSTTTMAVPPSAAASTNIKSKPCTKFFSTSGCPYGEMCHFLHFVPPLSSAAASINSTGVLAPGPSAAQGAGADPSLTVSGYKTRLCNRFNTPEGCRFGDNCHFAHGEADIRRPLNKLALSNSSSSSNNNLHMVASTVSLQGLINHQPATTLATASGHVITSSASFNNVMNMNGPASTVNLQPHHALAPACLYNNNSNHHTSDNTMTSSFNTPAPYPAADATLANSSCYHGALASATAAYNNTNPAATYPNHYSYAYTTNPNYSTPCLHYPSITATSTTTTNHAPPNLSNCDRANSDTTNYYPALLTNACSILSTTTTISNSNNPNSAIKAYPQSIYSYYNTSFNGEPINAAQIQQQQQQEIASIGFIKSSSSSSSSSSCYNGGEPNPPGVAVTNAPTTIANPGYEGSALLTA